MDSDTTSSQSIDVDPKRTSYTLKGLKSWQSYEISLVSVSKHGQSNRAKATFAVKGKRKANEKSFIVIVLIGMKEAY